MWEYRSEDLYVRSCVVTPRGDKLLVLYAFDLVCIDTFSGSVQWSSRYLDGEKEQVPGVEPLSENSFSPDGGGLVVVYTRYTPEELMEKGRTLVGDLTLLDPEKYGLK